MGFSIPLKIHCPRAGYGYSATLRRSKRTVRYLFLKGVSFFVRNYRPTDVCCAAATPAIWESCLDAVTDVVMFWACSRYYCKPFYLTSLTCPAAGGGITLDNKPRRVAHSPTTQKSYKSYLAKFTVTTPAPTTAIRGNKR